MTSTQDKVRSLFLTALMVFSVFAGSIAFAGTAAAANADTGGSSISPPTVDEQSTNTHSVTLSATDVDTSGDGNQVFVVNLNDGSLSNLDLSSTQVSNAVVDDGAVTVGSTNVDSTNNEISVTLKDDTSATGSATSDTVQVTFDITNVGAPAVSGTSSLSDDARFAIDSDDDGTREVPLTDFQTLTIDNVGSDTRPSTGSVGSYDIASSGQLSGDVGPGATVFQGEEDIRFLNPNGNEVAAESFKQTGDGSQVLELPIPADQPTGVYESSSFPSGSGSAYTVTVQTPRITELEVTNRNGDDVAGGSVNIGDTTQLTIDTDYNFEQAEPLDIAIEDSSGLEVTDEVLSTPGNEPVVDDDGSVTLAIDEGALENEEYTVTAEGDEDFDFGEASQSVTFDVTTGEDASIEVQEDQVTRGENVRFEINNAAEGDTHVVSIDADDVDSVPDSVFRNAGDTIATTSTDDDDALALIEIDDGVGVGSIDTSYLDETDVTVDVYGPDEADTETQLQAINDLTEDIGSSVDDDDFTVDEGGVTLENPRGSYVVGSEVTVNGTTTAGVDNVALYARDEGSFEYLLSISVDGDDTFEEDDIVLSNPSEGDVANDTLSIPGSYRIAAVDADDSALKSNIRADQNTSAISEAVGMQTSLRVTDTALTVDYVSIINGQVAVDDNMKINGSAPGQDEVSVSFYGPRGTYDRTTINVDSKDRFESENVDVGGNLGPDIGVDTELSQGNVVMSVLSNGRDGEAGNGRIDGYNSGNIETDFANFWADLNTGSNTQQQIIDQVASETVEDTGSDDISEVFQFRYTDGRVSIDSVTGEAGEPFTVETNDTMMVSGVTNRQPDDNTITVEVIEGPSSSAFDIESTDMWRTDGQWSVEIPTEGAEPGNYTVEASVGGNSDIRSFQVTGETLQEPTTETPDTETPDTETPDTETPDTDTPTEEPTTEEQMTEQQTDEPATTTETGPGFTAVLALVALVAAALLAVRRRD